MFFCLEEELPRSQVRLGWVELCLDLALRRAAGPAGCSSVSAVHGKSWGECGCLPGAGVSKEDLPVTTKAQLAQAARPSQAFCFSISHGTASAEGWRSTGGRSALIGKVGWEKGAGQAGGVLLACLSPGECSQGNSTVGTAGAQLVISPNNSAHPVWVPLSFSICCLSPT